ncbi:hypothetical protein BpHYR1_048561 [Brachionus plicatilis]|uniref:Uncharacterized protein n=1 Tax=Brachionus plicatilis TaxID=10195 RepID=A0A3M7SJL9_BRAPC|nr:hypothetical protein BpHYR1_048561 [Brachionus plicatilis]
MNGSSFCDLITLKLKRLKQTNEFLNRNLLFLLKLIFFILSFSLLCGVGKICEMDESIFPKAKILGERIWVFWITERVCYRYQSV